VSILLILGAGGHGRVVADAALRQGIWREIRATDRDAGRCAGELLPGIVLAAPEQALAGATAVHVAIGTAGARQGETEAIGSARLASIVHPQASVSTHARVGPGCFIAAQAVVAPGAQLGVGVIVNHGAVVDHDVSVGEYSHIAPRAGLGGAARIGKRVLVGTGACVLPGVSICDDATIGAGAVVHADVTRPGVYVGVPARKTK
jgi:sugar O-acyltransferase (sialic acid O-acetyltransferase NeuD family)